MRVVRIVLACMCLPVAILAVVVLRGVPMRTFLSAYWKDASHD